MKSQKLFSVMLAACLTVNLSHLPVFSASTAEAKAGDQITWNYDASSKTLVLAGKGKMYDFENEVSRPWNTVAAGITKLVIGDGIESIGDYAFTSFQAITEVTIPDSVKSLGVSAFSYDTGLVQVRLPDGLESIGDSCFAETRSLKVMEIPETVTEIGMSALSNSAAWYRSLGEEDFLIVGDGILYQYRGSDTDVTVPKTVKKLMGPTPFWTAMFVPMGEAEIFVSAPNQMLQSVTLPDTVSEIPAGIFGGDRALKTVKLPAGLKEIPDNAFSDCTSLQSVTLPETVKKIGNCAFRYCSSLGDLQIPKGVTSIGLSAFDKNPWIAKAGDFAVLGQGILYQMNGRQKIVHVPETVRTISPGVFQGIKIVEIQIPETVTEIQEKAIDCKNATIIGEPGSAAEQYATANSIPFRSVHDSTAPTGKDMTLDYAKDGWSFGNDGTVFGDDYYLNDIDKAHLESLGFNTAGNSEGWQGSCVGLAVTTILAKNGVFSPEQFKSGAKTLSDVEATDEVRSFINYFQRIQGSGKVKQSLEDNSVQFHRMVNTAKSIPLGESPFLLTFATKTGSHGVVGYGQESGKWTFDGKTYDSRILVWDSNFPKALSDEACLYYDSETFDYCIPYYGVHVAEADDDTAGIIAIISDKDILNTYPYPFTQHFKAGDINCDGKVNAADIALLQKHLTGRADLSESQQFLADVSGDQALNAVDLTALKQLLIA